MRKSISVAFFSLVSTLMVLGIVLMGCSEWVLFKNYFAKDRYETLDQVVGVTQRTAQYLVQQAELPEGDELDALSTKLEIIGESAEAYLFFTDNDGRVMIASSPDKLESLTVPEEMMEKIGTADADYYHVFGTLDGMLDGKSYITVSEMRNEHGQPSGYLFLCSSGEQLTQFKQQFWSNFLLSACVMLLCASILTKLLMRKLTDPLQKVTDAAQRFGGGDLMVQPLENIVADADIKGIKDEFFVIVPDDEHEGCFLPYLYVQLKDGYTLDDVRDKINACLPERYMRPVEIFTVPERPFFHFKTNRIGLCKEIIAKRNQQKEKAKRNSFADGCIA